MSFSFVSCFLLSLCCIVLRLGHGIGATSGSVVPTDILKIMLIEQGASKCASELSSSWIKKHKTQSFPVLFLYFFGVNKDHLVIHSVWLDWTLMNVSCSQVHMEASLGKFNQKVSMKGQFGIWTMSETLCTHATSKSVSRWDKTFVVTCCYITIRRQVVHSFTNMALQSA